jgi:prephenate dehydrogenase
VITPDDPPRRANVVGLGVIGGSVALALRSRGWHVNGEDTDPATVSRALSEGVVDDVGLESEVLVTVVAVPVDAVVEEVRRALSSTTGLVTDVGSVKGPVCSAIDDDRFLGGHPMAGSELEGLDGADEAMFEGAVWVLTPRPDVGDRTFSVVASLVADLGADVVAISPDAHDRLVAVVSHVPHLLAASLMRLASTRSEEHASLLRLAAGGFRDMTRIASGHPRIWLDICDQNRTAIIEALDDLGSSLAELRAVVARGDRDGLLDVLSEAREARASLPSRVTDPTTLAEFRIRIPDRAGAAAEVFTLAAELGVNIANFEVVHLAEGNRGLAVVLVDVGAAEVFRGGLLARGFRPTVSTLT